MEEILSLIPDVSKGCERQEKTTRIMTLRSIFNSESQYLEALPNIEKYVQLNQVMRQRASQMFHLVISLWILNGSEVFNPAYAPGYVKLDTLKFIALLHTLDRDSPSNSCDKEAAATRLSMAMSWQCIGRTGEASKSTWDLSEWDGKPHTINDKCTMCITLKEMGIDFMRNLLSAFEHAFVKANESELSKLKGIAILRSLSVKMERLNPYPDFPSEEICLSVAVTFQVETDKPNNITTPILTTQYLDFTRMNQTSFGDLFTNICFNNNMEIGPVRDVRVTEIKELGQIITSVSTISERFFRTMKEPSTGEQCDMGFMVMNSVTY